MGALKKTMLYLGLSEADAEEQRDYLDDYDAEYPQVEESQAMTPVTPIRSARTAAASGHGDLRRITTVHPRTYNDAKVIGEAFRAGTPVIMNLTDMTDAEAKRLVDFAAGLVFGLRGAIERVTSRVFLLSPATVEVATDAGESEPDPAHFFNQS